MLFVRVSVGVSSVETIYVNSLRVRMIGMDGWNPDNAYRLTVLKHGWQNDDGGKRPPTLIMDS